MRRFTFGQMLLFILMKYIAFYIFIMFKNSNFYFLKPGIRNAADLFYYLWMFLSLPIICSLLLAFPLYYSFRVKKVLYFFIVVSLVFIAEYFIYTYLASQTNLWNGVFNALISMVFFILFFYKSIKFIVNVR
jgi:hypothetical protein